MENKKHLEPMKTPAQDMDLNSDTITNTNIINITEKVKNNNAAGLKGSVFSGNTKKEIALNFIKETGCKILPQTSAKTPYKGFSWAKASGDPNELAEWEKIYTNCNYAALTGTEIIVIDIDIKNNQKGFETLREISPEIEKIKTLKVRTGSGGMHIYFKAPSNNGSIKSCTIGDGLEIKASGGCITLAGSIYADGREYKIIEDAPLADFPLQLLAHVKKPDCKKIDGCNADGTIPEGERNKTLLKLGASYKFKKLPENDVLKLLLEKNRAACKPPLPESEVKGIVKSIFNYEDKIIEKNKELDGRYFKIKNPSCLFDKFIGEPVSHQALNVFYKNNSEFLTTDDKGKIKSIYQGWLMQSENNADGIDYRPDLPPYSVFGETQNNITNKIFNSFSGMLEPDPSGDCTLFLKFVQEVIAHGDESIYTWLLHWMAKIVQKPTNRIYTNALALRSSQGTGKSFFFETLGVLLKKNYIKIDSVESILNFNTQLQGKILVYLEECNYSASKKESNRLKDLITSKEISINTKHITPYTIKSFVTIGSGTNDSISAPVEVGDRRWVCLELSEKRKEDKKYFDAIAKQLENGGYEKLMYVLKTFPLDFEILAKYPKTAIYYQNQALWMVKNKPVFSFLRQVFDEFMEGAMNFLSKLDVNDGYVQSSIFNSAYNVFLIKERIQGADAKAIIPQLKEILKTEDVTKRHYFNGIQERAYYIGTINNLDKILLNEGANDNIPF